MISKLYNRFIAWLAAKHLAVAAANTKADIVAAFKLVSTGNLTTDLAKAALAATTLDTDASSAEAEAERLETLAAHNRAESAKLAAAIDLLS